MTYTNGTPTDFNITSATTIYRIMGLAKNSTISSTNKSITMPYPVNFSGLHSFNIHCSSVRTKNLDSHQELSTSDIICVVNVNSSANGMIYYNKINDFDMDIKDRTINYLDFDLSDDEGNYIDFNNQHWHLTIQVNYIREFIKDGDVGFHDIVNPDERIKTWETK
jgi:hypothetical protein